MEEQTWSLDKPCFPWLPNRALTVCAALLYFAVLCVVSVHLARIFYYKHRLVSFQVGFLAFCALMTALRCGFFTAAAFKCDASQWRALWLVRLVYWLPQNVEFATFSLFAEFCTRIISVAARRAPERNPLVASLTVGASGEWKMSRLRLVERCSQPFVMWATVNIILLLLTVAWLVAVDIEGPEVSLLNRTLRNVFVGTVFALLSIIVGVQGVRLSLSLRHDEMMIHLFLPSTTTAGNVMFLTLVIVILFASRALYDFASLPSLSGSEFGVSDASLNPLSFVWLVLWEVVPIALIIYTFRRIPKTRLGGLQRSQPRRNESDLREASVIAGLKTPARRGLVQGVDASARTAQAPLPLFSDLSRYDSDEEDDDGGLAPAGAYVTPGRGASQGRRGYGALGRAGGGQGRGAAGRVGHGRPEDRRTSRQGPHVAVPGGAVHNGANDLDVPQGRLGASRRTDSSGSYHLGTTPRAFGTNSP